MNKALVVVGIAACGLSACYSSSRTVNTSPTPGGAGTTTVPSGAASAVMHDATGNTLGTLVVATVGQAISVSGMLQGLTPGVHGIHLHAVGRCDPPAFTSAGGHWNPMMKMHGLQSAQGPHAGDLPNITVTADGMAMIQVSTSAGTLFGPNGLMDGDGAAVVIHAGPDDNVTDPAGNSGARVACGVIGGS